MGVDRARMEAFLDWEGPVGRHYAVKIAQFEEIVRANAPFDPEHTTHIAESISSDLSSDSRKLLAKIGTYPNEHIRGYAAMVHGGTRPHAILPHHPPKTLKFRVAGRLVYATRVNHPGTRPDPFLARWIRELV